MLGLEQGASPYAWLEKGHTINTVSAQLGSGLNRVGQLPFRASIEFDNYLFKELSDTIKFTFWFALIDCLLDRSQQQIDNDHLSVVNHHLSGRGSWLGRSGNSVKSFRSAPNFPSQNRQTFRASKWRVEVALLHFVLNEHYSIRAKAGNRVGIKLGSAFELMYSPLPAVLYSKSFLLLSWPLQKSPRSLSAVQTSCC